MAQFNSYRPGNLVIVTTGQKDHKIGRITNVEKFGDQDVYTLMLSDGQILRLKDGLVRPLQLFPSRAGFSSIDHVRFTDGILDLTDITEVEDDGLEESDVPHDFVTKFSKLGFEASLSSDHTKLYAARWDDHEQKTMGIFELHELQNLCTDLVPGHELDLSYYKNL